MCYMKILIVDDDIMIRNWLTMLLGQIQGYSVEVFSAGDVFSALECCNKDPIDLVITDITMPQKTGLQLIETLRQEHPHIKTAVLSAYDNYEYIRQALRQGSLDYILKSEMKLDDVVALLEKASMAGELSTREMPRENYLRFHRANQALQAFLDNDEMAPEQFFEEAGCSMELGSIAVYAFCIGSPLETEPERYLLQNVSDRTLESEKIQGLSFCHKNDLFLVLYQPKSNIVEDKKNEQMKLSLLMQRNLSSYCQQKIEYSVFQPSRNAGTLRTSIHECLLLMDMHSYYVGEKVSLPFHRLLDEDVQELTQELKKKLELYRDSKDALASLKSALQGWHKEMAVPSDIKTALIHIMLQLFMSLSESAFGYLYTSEYQNFSAKINQAATMDELEKAAAQFAAYFEECCGTESGPMNPAIRAAIDYIDENYAEKLTLEDVASQIYLNKTYVSQLFKKELDVSFGDYLENVRIGKAKELLRTTAKSISQISEEVGYTSQSYFTKVFKKSAGMGPLRYRALAEPGGTTLGAAVALGE